MAMAETSLRFWQARQRILPQLLSASERQAIGRYSALLQTLATASKYVSKAIAQTMALFPNVRKALPCWAVTSLSARGRLPLPCFYASDPAPIEDRFKEIPAFDACGRKL